MPVTFAGSVPATEPRTETPAKTGVSVRGFSCVQNGVSQPMTHTLTLAFDVKTAAKYLGVHPRTMDNWRSQHRGPRYYRCGSRVTYRAADLDAYLAANAVDPEAV
jgi:hypothetical protein